MVEKKDEVAKVEPVVQETNDEMLAKIDEATKKLQVENQRLESNQALAEAAKVEASLAGVSEAGQPPKKEEVSDKDYAEKVLSGEVPEAIK